MLSSRSGASRPGSTCSAKSRWRPRSPTLSGSLEAARAFGQCVHGAPVRRCPPVVEARRLIGSGAIGRVSSADALLAHRGPKHAPWFFDAAEAEWGVLADLGIYLISQLTHLFGPAETVIGRVKTVFPERLDEAGRTIRVTVDDNVAAILEWPIERLRRSGPIGAPRRTAATSSARRESTEQRASSSSTQRRRRIRSLCSPRSCAIPGATEIAYNGMSNCYRPALAPFDGDIEIMRAFSQQISLGKGDGSNAARQRHVIEIIDRLYASSASGTAAKMGGLEAHGSASCVDWVGAKSGGRPMSADGLDCGAT